MTKERHYLIGDIVEVVGDDITGVVIQVNVDGTYFLQLNTGGQVDDAKSTELKLVLKDFNNIDLRNMFQTMSNRELIDAILDYQFHWTEAPTDELKANEKQLIDVAKAEILARMWG